MSSIVCIQIISILIIILNSFLINNVIAIPEHFGGLINTPVPWGIEGVRQQDDHNCWDTFYTLQKKNLVIKSLAENKDSLGITVKIHPVKNRTVYTTRDYLKGEYICEYVGEKMSLYEFKESKKNHSNLEYMFGVNLDGKPIIFNALKENGRLCRLMNHSLTKPTAEMAVIQFNGEFRVLFVVKENLKKGTELLYSYQTDVKLIEKVVGKEPNRSWLWD